MKKILSTGALFFLIANSLAACSFIPTFSEPELGAAYGAYDELDSAMTIDSIHFSSEAATLPAEAHDAVDRTVVYLLDNPDSTVTVQGHTDSVGPEEHNQMLSEMRAGTIVRVLKSKGIGDDRITAIGYGESDPIGDNTTPDGRRENRRVELVVQ